ncbi:hypothetical protein [Leucobacter ruminantium]|uniref:Uncharacterized protein n=1 Tax=Leucobacter ruminantium TaxID=1289170 RepID=A0A939RY64_9MICO|nr:hypothetical protein [Leucobacter ruminantium]MBO1804546.1 hypothetical protein [Leucobacter ruminantium]
MDENDMDELDEFAGASFIYLGYLNETHDGGRTYFKPKVPEWFAIRPRPNRHC